MTALSKIVGVVLLINLFVIFFFVLLVGFLIEVTTMKGMTIGMFSGAVVLILVWVLKQFFQVEIPAEVAGAVGIVIQGVVHQFLPESK